MAESLKESLIWAAAFVDGVAVLVMCIGFFLSMIAFVRANLTAITDERLMGLQLARCQLGIYLAFGLELMIISDLMHSMVSHTLTDLGFLGALVLIRTLIGYFLNREIQELKHQ